ncbi:MAG: glutamate--tRNA ligase [Longimicrobiales bacterium]
MTTVRTRFAPSPTGRLHLGNVRAAAFNWLFARRHGGCFVLRIEDTDTERNVPGGEAMLLEDLKWLGLDWDEGPDVGGPHAPYRQSERAAGHVAAAERLREEGRAYPCFCTEDELARRSETGKGGREVLRYDGRCRRLTSEERARRTVAGEPHVLRFAVPQGTKEVEVEDEVYGSISFPEDDIDDFVIRRSDGRVTYNFAVVVDDIDMAISHVIRGAGHVSNTPKQVLLFDALGARRPVFAHLPTVLGPDGRKLSKREGAAAVAQLRAEGYPPDAVLNYLSLLGWSHPHEKEVLERGELVSAIALDRVGRSDTQMDPEKLRWVSAQHLERETLDELTEHVRPWLAAADLPDGADPRAVVDVLRSRMATWGDVTVHLPLLFPDPDGAWATVRSTLAADPEAVRVLSAVREALAGLDSWTPDRLDARVREAGREAGVRGAALFHPVRNALTGAEQGPQLGKVLAAIGPEESLRRLALP